MMEATPVLASWSANINETDRKGRFRIVATKVGAKCYTADGRCLIWTAKALKEAAPTWVGGNVTANHQKGINYGSIVASEFDGVNVIQEIEVNDRMSGWISRNKDDIGVSIEGSVFPDDNQDIQSGRGTDVTIVFPPQKPVCSIEEGCKVLASEADPVTITGSSESNGESSMTEVTASEHQKALDEVASLKAKLDTKEVEVAASVKDVADLRAKVDEQAKVIASYVEKEKTEVMASLSEAIGAEAAGKFADKPICVLRDMMAVAAAFKAKNAAEEGPEGSGAVAMPRGEGVNASTQKSPLEIEAEAAEKEFRAKYALADKE